ncbi:hypothetical protein Dda_5633 [Drechslerella dactyloides]|uniref:Uncharacterized protein n=1 Tax=Drechslerella dactyloides TaxID=74499 RepID=A0AAD6NIW8_DREDA|nr:hypothetical protein Dda_5633 [Drechslerella dactyloides]
MEFSRPEFLEKFGICRPQGVYFHDIMMPSHWSQQTTPYAKNSIERPLFLANSRRERSIIPSDDIFENVLSNLIKLERLERSCQGRILDWKSAWLVY